VYISDEVHIVVEICESPLSRENISKGKEEKQSG